ncbi:MAG TPA: ATP-binding protein [Solirubrobacteraceae bacterium]
MGSVGESAHPNDDSALRIRLPRDSHAPSMARAAVAGFSERSSLGPGGCSTLALLVSELVSNAVLHSDAPPASDIRLCARLLDDARVRVEVVDDGSGFTVEPRDPSRIDGGYGLFLLDRQATQWGVDREGGTRVWFEIGDRATPDP